MSEHKIPMGLRSAYRLMHRRTEGCLAPLGVTADQFVLLALLQEEDGITQQELARRASSDPNTVRAMLVLLEKGGLIERRPHPDDGRALSVMLTGKGRRRFQVLAETVEPLRDRLSQLFSERESALLIEFLNRISEAMFEGERSPEPTRLVAGASVRRS